MYDLNLALNSFLHSAKGTVWKDHKYIKRVNGIYYYPDDYEGGRHLPDSKKDKKAKNIKEIGDKLKSRKSLFTPGIGKEVGSNDWLTKKIGEISDDVYNRVIKRYNEIKNKKVSTKKKMGKLQHL